MRGLRVGITIGLREPDETLWNNGIKQNAVFLSDALRRCPSVESVVLVNTTSVPVTFALPWDAARWPTWSFDDVKDRLDILIELGGQIDGARTDYLKSRGARLVSYCCGSEYILAVEAMMFGKSLWGGNLFVNDRYDDLWFIPQVAGNTQSYLEVMRRQTGRVVPFVWSPEFVEARSRGFPHGGIYQPRNLPRRLTVMEPNINIVKFCLYPILIAELAYRARPDDIELLQVTNALSMAQMHPDFIALMNHLDIVRRHKAVFTGRHETPTFLAQNTDIVISHQLENPLNYFYLEVCWQGYPLIHNATLCADLGYYYEGNDAQRGAARVCEAMDHHDVSDAYRLRQRRLIGRYAPDSEEVVRKYEAYICQLMSRPVRKSSG
ncbi:DUF2827 domain-containing protein [Paraburkholderia sp. J12]|uniref:DUF2827 domain-containing protein n=1 Tax=Paraburkholderia sp. J12 TaxID=2805432 RepID=UPI002ABDBB41|nr:DUF2827 domain-containing protein [Paraburkholderia sp. J12]